MAGQKIVSMTMLTHIDLDTDTRDAYLRTSKARRRLEGDEEENNLEEVVDNDAANIALTEEQFEQLAAREEFILSATENGYGKRTSAFEYRITKRGGQGVANITTEGRNGPVVASFPVEDSDQIMLVTDGGKIIRSPVADIRIAGRSTQGVTLFDTADDEQVVSVAHLKETENDDNDNEDTGDEADIETQPASVESKAEETAAKTK